MFPFINPKTDFAFKKIFGSPQSKGILLSFLNALLYDGTPTIQDLEIIDPYQAPRIEGMKESFLDVKAQLSEGRAVIIEMQVLNVLGFKKRVLYNAAKAFSTQLKTGDDYTLINPVIALTITDFEMFPHSDRVISRYQLKEKHELTDDSDDIELVFAELPKFNKDINELETLSDKWLYFIKEANHLESIPPSLNQEPAIQNAFEVALQSHLTRDEMETLDRQAMFIHDSRNALLLAQQQGTQQGRQEGRQEGLREGIQEGRKKEKVAIARSLLNKLSISEISQVTGLTVEDIETLQ